MNAWQAIAQKCGAPGRGEKSFIRTIVLTFGINYYISNV